MCGVWGRGIGEALGYRVGQETPRGGKLKDTGDLERGVHTSQHCRAGPWAVSLGPPSAEGLPKGGLPGPIGETFLEEDSTTLPSAGGAGSAPSCLPASLQEKADGSGAAHWSPMCKAAGPGPPGRGWGWGLQLGTWLLQGRESGRA